MRFWLGPILVIALLVGGFVVPVDTPAQTTSVRARRRRAPRLPRVTAAERRQIQRRHARAATSETRRWRALDPAPLVLRVGGSLTPFTATPIDPTLRTFDESALAVVQQALACRDGTTHEIHPRLVSLLYETVQHFGVPYLNVVSGYRSGSATSRHGQGRAIDFALPGVTDTRLAAWLRPRGFVGVGIYPTSGFVHLDVRARSYYWRDASGPRERNRERQMLSALGPRHDRDARARGIEPVPDLASETEIENETVVETEIQHDSEGSVELEVVTEVATPPTLPDGGVP